MPKLKLGLTDTNVEKLHWGRKSQYGGDVSLTHF